MRALPVIVDLFVLLTIFAVVLFFAALGRSAPNEASINLAMIEATIIVDGPSGPLPAVNLMRFRPELVAQNGDVVSGEIGEVTLEDTRQKRFLIRNAPEGARLRLVVTEIDAEAFAHETISMDLRRIYPGTESNSSVAPIGQAPLSSVGVD